MANLNFWSGGDIPWISSKEVVGGVLTDTERKVTRQAVEETSLRLIPAGSVAVVVRSGILLHTFPVALVPFETTVNQDIKIGTPRQGVLSEYLAYCLDAHGQQILERCRKTGTTVQSVDVPGFLAFEVPLPPLPVQRRIVDLIGALDAHIEVLDSEVASAESLLARQRDALPQAEEMPLGSVLSGIDSGKSVLTAGEEPVEGCPRILKISAVRPGLFSPGEAKGLGPEVAMPEASRVREGDLLITRSNTPDRVGYCARARDVPGDTFMPDLIWRLRLDGRQCEPDYLEQALASPTIRARLISTASGTSASMRKINKQGFSTLLVPVPCLTEQRKYAQSCLAIFSIGRALRVERDALQRVRALVLGSLLSGGVEIPESFGALLEAV